jgi:hypothetical protein
MSTDPTHTWKLNDAPGTRAQLDDLVDAAAAARTDYLAHVRASLVLPREQRQHFPGIKSARERLEHADKSLEAALRAIVPVPAFRPGSIAIERIEAAQVERNQRFSEAVNRAIVPRTHLLNRLNARKSHRTRNILLAAAATAFVINLTRFVHIEW